MVKVASTCAPSAHAAPALHVSPRAAVPGQVVVLSSQGVAVKRAQVRIGGERARRVPYAPAA